MIRAAAAGVLGFILIFIESLIVMWLKGLQTIEFDGMSPFISIWAMNFFLVFTIATHIQTWFVNRPNFNKAEEDNFY